MKFYLYCCLAPQGFRIFLIPPASVSKVLLQSLPLIESSGSSVSTKPEGLQKVEEVGNKSLCEQTEIYTINCTISICALIGCRNTRHLIARIPNAFSIFLRALDNPGDIYLFKVKNRNTRKRCEICSKIMIKTPERRHNRRSSVFIVNFEYISRLVLVFLLLTLNM